MLYDFGDINTFVNTNYEDNLLKQLTNLKKIYSSYKNKQKQLKAFMNKLSGNSTEPQHLTLLQKHTSQLIEDTYNDIDDDLKFLSNMEIDLNSTFKLEDKDRIKEMLSRYSNEESDLRESLSEFDKSFDTIASNVEFLDDLEKANTVDEKAVKVAVNANVQNANTERNNIQQITTSTVVATKEKERNVFEDLNYMDDDLMNLQDGNLLYVSESEDIILLPYYAQDIRELYNSRKHNYYSIKEIIRKKYTLPFSRYKDSSLGRFFAAYKLVRTKENGTISQAIDLGFELMKKREINPIIITACRNLEELDYYLDCLDANSLDKFDCFDIQIKITPMIINYIPEF